MADLQNLDKLPVGAEMVIAKNGATSEPVAKVVHLGGGMIQLYRLYQVISLTAPRTMEWKPSDDPRESSPVMMTQAQLDRFIAVAVAGF